MNKISEEKRRNSAKKGEFMYKEFFAGPIIEKESQMFFAGSLFDGMIIGDLN